MNASKLTLSMLLALSALILSCQSDPATTERDAPASFDATRDTVGDSSTTDGVDGTGPATATCANAEGIPVFPGAQGAGSTTPAGRGGDVIEVTTLADAGPGSLREALTRPGPRTIVFRVAGTIDLSESVYITEPFVTVAGQTAPGDGILLKNGALVVATHDVLVQHLRVRRGTEGSGDPETSDALEILGPGEVDPSQSGAYRVVIDHVSVSWSQDEVVAVWGGAYDVTISNSIISEALDEAGHPKGTHSAGLLVGDGSTCVSIIGNYLANNDFRNPLIASTGVHDVRNNVVYNWGILPAEVTQPLGLSVQINFVGNVYKIGPSSLTDDDASEVKFHLPEPGQARPEFYFEDNDWPILNPLLQAVLDSGMELPFVLSDAPFDIPHARATPSATLADTLLASVGALPTRRDSVDARVVQQFFDGSGAIIDSPDEVGGYPIIAAGTAILDEDHDGMDDAWEAARGLDPGDPDDHLEDPDGDGYTNLEVYLHGLE